LISGPTRKETRLSEAGSYSNLAIANSYFGLLSHVDVETRSMSRILLEERALDSYYNILFSIIVFWRQHGVWPDRLTIVSHEFKRTRLIEGHCAAMGFPLDKVGFVGINPPGMDSLPSSSGTGEASLDTPASQDKVNAMPGIQLATGQWSEDPHGTGEALAFKRRQRNCWNVSQLLFQSDDERARSGARTRILEDGSEALLEHADRPWGA
jgi:dihydrofolate synthase